VDSLKPAEIIVSFSSLSHWNEPPAIAVKEEIKSVSKLGIRDKSDRDSHMGDVPSEITFAPDVQSNVAGNMCLSFIVFAVVIIY